MFLLHNTSTQLTHTITKNTIRRYSLFSLNSTFFKNTLSKTPRRYQKGLSQARRFAIYSCSARMAEFSKIWTAPEVRKEYIHFFEKRGHTIGEFYTVLGIVRYIHELTVVNLQLHLRRLFHLVMMLLSCLPIPVWFNSRGSLLEQNRLLLPLAS